MDRWMHPPLQGLITPRAQGDIFISVPPKSGTTWMMNIVHQLRTGGDADLEDIYAEVPWPEIFERPGQTKEELKAKWDKMPQTRRAFKTHSHPGACLGFHRKTDELEVKYVVVMRDVEEAVVSLWPFLNKHNDEHWKNWDCLEAVQAQWKLGEPFETFFKEAVVTGPAGMPPEMKPEAGFLSIWFFDFINSWWPLRHEPNVLMLHFSEMKRDHEGSIRKVADFLGFEPSPEDFAKICKYTSFADMKENQHKYEMRTVLRDKDGKSYPILSEGAMVRSGTLGRAAADGMTPEIAKIIHDYAEKLVPDDKARSWMFNGGAID